MIERIIGVLAGLLAIGIAVQMIVTLFKKEK